MYVCTYVCMYVCIYIYTATAACAQVRPVTHNVSSYCYICVLILRCVLILLLYMCPHTAMYVSSYPPLALEEKS
jgi:hypothetical protein